MQNFTILNLLDNICSTLNTSSTSSYFRNLFEVDSLTHIQYNLNRLQTFFNQNTSQIPLQNEEIFPLCNTLNETIDTIDFSQAMDKISFTIENMNSFDSHITSSFQDKIHESRESFYSSIDALKENLNEENAKASLSLMFTYRNDIFQALNHEYQNPSMYIDKFNKYVNNFSLSIQNILFAITLVAMFWIAKPSRTVDFSGVVKSIEYNEQENCTYITASMTGC